MFCEGENMSFHKSVNDMLSRHGSVVKIQTGDIKTQTKAFIQPLRYKSQYTSKLGFGGKIDDNNFLYIGSADCTLCEKTPSIVTLSLIVFLYTYFAFITVFIFNMLLS